MSFPFNFYSLALLGSFVVAFVSLPLWARWCIRTGHVDDPGHRKIHDAPIPLAGGLAVFTGLALPVLAGGLAVYFGAAGTALAYGIGRRAVELSAIVFGALGMTILGVVDDKHELRPGIDRKSTR